MTFSCLPKRLFSSTAIRMVPRLNHTMFRVKDNVASLKFYTEVLGMELLDQMSGSDFTNYFLAFPEEGCTKTAAEKKSTKLQREGILELCHNWGTEKDANFSYASGNSDPGRGFGHICYTVDDLTTEVARLDAFGTVQWKKRPEDGTMKYIAFILDPDNYWIEVIGNAAR